jgi:carbonyl reductase 1
VQILVTGGNQGIGFALCKQLAIQHNCHVFLTARTPAKGLAAVSKINDSIAQHPSCTGSVQFIPLDTSSDDSVAAAAQEARSKLSAGDAKLYGIVNNAGIGLNTADSGDVLQTNLYGPKRVNEHFIDLLDEKNGRIVNLGSGAGPSYVSGCSIEEKKALCSPDTITWEFIEQHAKAKLNSSGAYGLSKSLLACYTGVFAREHPNILTSCVSPGFIDTQMTAGWGASKTPEQGLLPITHCLFEDLAGSGWYYGSDAVRSPYHFMRNPGEPAYDGINPFL